MENLNKTLVLCFAITLFSVLFRSCYSYAHALTHVLPHAHIFLPVIPRSFLTHAHSFYVKESNWKWYTTGLGDNECQPRKKIFSNDGMNTLVNS